jgi:hypothetical protein
MEPLERRRLTMFVSCGCSVMRNRISLYSISAGAGRMILPVILQAKSLEFQILGLGFYYQKETSKQVGNGNYFKEDIF